MAKTEKKFLDYSGLVKVLQELQNYPDNRILGAVINAIQEALDDKADIADIPDINTENYVQKTDLATQSTAGLMSANDKLILDNMNPNMTVALSNIYEPEVHVINAKMEDMVDLEIIEQPHISEQIRTINLLDANTFTPGFYIGSNGQLASNTNDHVGDFIPVSPGDDIYYTGIIGPTNSGSINRRLHVYDANQK